MAIQKWRIISQETIFEHPRLVLVEDTVILPSGESTKYLRYKRSGDAATIIAINDDNQILLQQEYSHPPGEVLYQFPGGGVPTGEVPAGGANRELMEECHLSGDIEEIGSYYLDNRRTDAKMYVFVATNLKTAKLPADDEEFIENMWQSEEEIDTLISKGKIKHTHMLAAWTLFKSWWSRNSSA